MLGGKLLARAPDLLYPTYHGWGFHSSASTIMSYIKLAPVTCLALGVLLSVFIVFLMHRRRPQLQSLMFEGSLKFGGGWKISYPLPLEFGYKEILLGIMEDDVIGVGGSGKVRRVHLNRRKDRQYQTVALKELRRKRNQAGEELLDKLFDAEVNTLGLMRHPNIITLFCCITGIWTSLLVYEDMQNGSLDQWLHKSTGRLDWPSRVGMATDTARGLSYMHDQAIIHRNVKSSNILLDHNFKAKIGDFGLARVLAKPGESEVASAICGTPGHIAPDRGVGELCHGRMVYPPLRPRCPDSGPE
ncbi:leucine-rich repeat receptor-like kinase protein SUNN isoform X4 [Miscanthus floridulus]|uniref:leucine-rich repeat receptor-like kinase protein SUNN isoform X4 n=1 Tax=Miscanthus floridulus TaxID=154761 RepID=UPI0034587C3C